MKRTNAGLLIAGAIFAAATWFGCGKLKTSDSLSRLPDEWDVPANIKRLRKYMPRGPAIGPDTLNAYYIPKSDTLDIECLGMEVNAMYLEEMGLAFTTGGHSWSLLIQGRIESSPRLKVNGVELECVMDTLDDGSVLWSAFGTASDAPSAQIMESGTSLIESTVGGSSHHLYLNVGGVNMLGARRTGKEIWTIRKNG